MYTAQGKINHDALLEEHLPAVRRQARARQVKLPSGIDRDDLIQAGTVGLLDALQRFDANAGASFSTFASQRIRGAMIDELRTRDWLPRSVRRNARAVDELEARGMSVTPVFISVDPARDTPEVVGDFAANMHPKMIGLTGSPAQVKAASDAYRTYYKAHEDEGEDYLVDHSTFSYLVMPGEGFVDFFRRDVPPEQLADKVACFVEHQ